MACGLTSRSIDCQAMNSAMPSSRMALVYPPSTSTFQVPKA